MCYKYELENGASQLLASNCTSGNCSAVKPCSMRNTRCALLVHRVPHVDEPCGAPIGTKKAMMERGRAALTERLLTMTSL